MIIVTSCRFRKAPFSKCFPSTLERKADDFKVLRFEDRFRKAAFSVRVSVDGSSYRRNKAAFSNLSGNVVGFFFNGKNGHNQQQRKLFCEYVFYMKCTVFKMHCNFFIGNKFFFSVVPKQTAS